MSIETIEIKRSENGGLEIINKDPSVNIDLVAIAGINDDDPYARLVFNI